jgi:hypothetical protein
MATVRGRLRAQQKKAGSPQELHSGATRPSYDYFPPYLPKIRKRAVAAFILDPLVGARSLNRVSGPTTLPRSVRPFTLL